MPFLQFKIKFRFLKKRFFREIISYPQKFILVQKRSNLPSEIGKLILSAFQKKVRFAFGKKESYRLPEVVSVFESQS